MWSRKQGRGRAVLVPPFATGGIPDTSEASATAVPADQVSAAVRRRTRPAVAKASRRQQVI